MDQISKMSNEKLISEFFKLQKQINLQTIKYNFMIDEILKRFPNIQQQEIFKKGEIK